jgi:hypothetical protein
MKKMRAFLNEPPFKIYYVWMSLLHNDQNGN